MVQDRSRSNCSISPPWVAGSRGGRWGLYLRRGTLPGCPSGDARSFKMGESVPKDVDYGAEPDAHLRLDASSVPSGEKP